MRSECPETQVKTVNPPQTTANDLPQTPEDKKPSNENKSPMTEFRVERR